MQDYYCASFFKIIKKAGNESDLIPYEKDGYNYSPVKNAYDSLWQEFRYSDDADIVLNSAHRIIEYYFLQTCGQQNIREQILDKHEEDFTTLNTDGTEEKTRYNITSSLVAWASDTVPSLRDELYFDPSAVDKDMIRNVMKDVFDVLGQSAHYSMMWGRVERK